jgi:hypothetical protein
MSQNEFHTGKLSLVDLKGKTPEEFAKEVCIAAGISEISSYHDSWLEEFRYELAYEKYFIVDGEIYEMIEHSESDDEYFVHMNRNEDGTISFSSQFYNGGTCLSEIIEESISEMNKKGLNEYKQ